MRIAIDARASQRQHICALQTGSRSSIPPARPIFPTPFKTCHASSPDGPNTFQAKGCAVDDRLAQPDADRGYRRPRGDARAQCIPDHGVALGPWPVDAVPADPLFRRLRGAENVAAVTAWD